MDSGVKLNVKLQKEVWSRDVTSTNTSFENNLGKILQLDWLVDILMKRCVYDKDHMSALRIKNTSESDPHSYEVT